jgi:hypothetical protein
MQPQGSLCFMALSAAARVVDGGIQRHGAEAGTGNASDKNMRFISRPDGLLDDGLVEVIAHQVQCYDAS